MWFLIQLMMFVGSLGSFVFVFWSDRKTGGLVRAVARTKLGSTATVVAKMIWFVLLIAIFTRLGWYPLTASVFISLFSLIWAWSSPKSPEDFE